MANIVRQRNKRYKTVAQLAGHRGEIREIVPQRLGYYLASGGEDGVRVWDLNNYCEVDTPAQNKSQLGPVTSLIWASEFVICFGTALGWVVMWEIDTEAIIQFMAQKRGNGTEICCLAADWRPDMIRMALGARDGLIQVWYQYPEKQPVMVFSRQLGTSIPKFLLWADEYIYAYGMLDGEISKVHAKRGDLIDVFGIGTPIGHAALNIDQSEILIDNGKCGFDLYEMDKQKNLIYARTFETKQTGRRFLTQCVFAERDRVVVGGSDHGIACVFDAKSTRRLDTLRHEHDGYVQAIAACGDNETCRIFTGSYSPALGHFITVWEYTKLKDGEEDVVRERIRETTTTQVTPGIETRQIEAGHANKQAHYIAAGMIYIVLGTLLFWLWSKWGCVNMIIKNLRQIIHDVLMEVLLSLPEN